MSFYIDDKKLLEKYIAILNKIKDLLSHQSVMIDISKIK